MIFLWLHVNWIGRHILLSMIYFYSLWLLLVLAESCAYIMWSCGSRSVVQSEDGHSLVRFICSLLFMVLATLTLCGRAWAPGRASSHQLKLGDPAPLTDCFSLSLSTYKLRRTEFCAWSSGLANHAKAEAQIPLRTDTKICLTVFSVISLNSILCRLREILLLTLYFLVLSFYLKLIRSDWYILS